MAKKSKSDKPENINNLDISRCSSCAKEFIPQRPYCNSCRNPTSSVQCPGKGTLISYTTLYVTPEGFTPPLILGIAKLKKGLSVFGEVKDYRLRKTIDIGDELTISEDNGKYFFNVLGK